MPSLTIKIGQATPEFASGIEMLAADAFGPGRFARTAFRLREHVPHRADLSFIALIGPDSAPPELAGSVILTDILIGQNPALLLGPLVVSPHHQKMGIGRELMNRSIRAASEGDRNLIILVGDLPYYARFGFNPVPKGQIVLPGPVDPQRLLACELEPFALRGHAGKARNALQICDTG
jgi:predicted N-acetyltransferase YhbS